MDVGAALMEKYDLEVQTMMMMSADAFEIAEDSEMNTIVKRFSIHQIIMKSDVREKEEALLVADHDLMISHGEGSVVHDLQLL